MHGAFSVYSSLDILANHGRTRPTHTLERSPQRGIARCCRISVVVMYGLVEPPLNSEFYMYLFHPTIGATPALEGGLTNSPFVYAISGQPWLQSRV